jgi:hypothetical protein
LQLLSKLYGKLFPVERDGAKKNWRLRMKKESEAVTLNVPPSTHALLVKACESETPRLTLGQMVTKLAYDKYGHLDEKHRREMGGSVREGSQGGAEAARAGAVAEESERKKAAADVAAGLLKTYDGNKTAALRAILPEIPQDFRREIAEAINNSANG